MRKRKIRKAFINKKRKNVLGLQMHLDGYNKRYIFKFGTVKL